MWGEFGYESARASDPESATTHLSERDEVMSLGLGVWFGWWLSSQWAGSGGFIAQYTFDENRASHRTVTPELLFSLTYH